MNVLLVTETIPEARALEHELVRLLPSLNLDTVQAHQEAIGRLASSKPYAAVLLDDARADLVISVARASRTSGNHPLIICLVGSENSTLAKDLLAAGADDYVAKGLGFANRLASILSGVSVTDDRLHGGRSFRILYGSRPDSPDVIATGGGSTRDRAGATRVLIRSNAHPQEWQRLEEALERAQNIVDERAGLFQKERQALQSLRNLYRADNGDGPNEAAAGEMKQMPETADLRQKVSELEARLHAAEERLRMEQEKWNRLLVSFRQGLLAIERRRAGLQNTVNQQQSRHSAERAAWESARSEFEFRIARLQQELSLLKT